jgi:hypothetical protein
MTRAKGGNDHSPALRTEVYNTYRSTSMPTNLCQRMLLRQGDYSTFIIKILSTELHHSFTYIQCWRLRKAGAISLYRGSDSWRAVMDILRAPAA